MKKETNVKLYHFNPNVYGWEYYIAAESKIKAHEYLLKYLESCGKVHRINLEIWKEVNPLDDSTFPSMYTLDEHEIGSVIESEMS